MTIDIQYVQMPTSEAMNELMNTKLNRLAAKYEWIIRAQVYFKQENDPTGKGKICEMELSAPGPRIFASSNEDDFEKAAAKTIKDLEKQLSKRKSIMNKH
ncbi:ribosome hibernation-promoting factor, HPF/YfiA family [Maribacter arenosus]|uniref:Ribosome-associated translation inhibitor RaiA n=1 Tax=Maribacter arenosus TaxID=1854708 RepID=A0ABR7VAX3_9FLAO|nr:ribosome-associated translation inhibitor RaiA [Maribacter arenosus]MBD0849209.1 ribosome-associated translation inhibitor RaiA [Maribacter arenosus]